MTKSHTTAVTITPTPITTPTHSPNIVIQLPQTSAQAVGPVQAYAPYVGSAILLLIAIITAFYTFRRGQMDARHSYASEILKHRMKQVQEFYAPALIHIEQSRIVYEKLKWAIKMQKGENALEAFRLLDSIHEFGAADSILKPYIDQIIDIGEKLTALISEKSGLIEGGITSTFIDYQSHFSILKTARERKNPLSPEEKEGWQEFGYYPRLLNRAVREGYKIVLSHLENYEQAGDRVICQILKQKPVEIGKYRRQLMENLQHYEKHASDYAAKFDSFDLSNFRDHFIKALEDDKYFRPKDRPIETKRIMDAGCGTGRDTYEFLKKGYTVTGVDASPAMLRLWKRKIRTARKKPESPEMEQAAEASESLEWTFDEIHFRNEFDGVWAAASLLHIAPAQFAEVLQKLFQSLRPNGVLFVSMKHGQGERLIGGRTFSYQNRREFTKTLRKNPDVEEIRIWLSDAAGKNLSDRKQKRAWALEYIGRYDADQWLNVLVRKRPVGRDF